jgi:hypothetical protein
MSGRCTASTRDQWLRSVEVHTKMENRPETAHVGWPKQAHVRCEIWWLRPEPRQISPRRQMHDSVKHHMSRLSLGSNCVLDLVKHVSVGLEPRTATLNPTVDVVSVFCRDWSYVPWSPSSMPWQRWQRNKRAVDMLGFAGDVDD